jgi:hypothetical protein
MKPWPTVKLGEVLRLDLDRVPVDAATSCPMVGVLSFGRGLFEREPILGDDLWSRFKGGKAGTLWYHRAVLTAFTEPRLRPLAADLDATVTELEKLANDGKPVVEPPLTTN